MDYSYQSFPFAKRLVNVNLATLSRNILFIAFWTYVIVSLIDPYDQMFHCKSILFLTVFAIWAFRLANGFTRRCGVQLWAAVVMFGAVIPLAATLIGLLGGRQPLIGMRFDVLEMFLMLFLILPVESDRIDLSSILIRSCIVVAIIEIAIAVVSIASPLLYAAIYEFTAAKQSAYLSIDTDRLGLGLGSFYYKTSATMILPFGYYLAKIVYEVSGRVKNGLLALLYLLALFVSGARANVLGAAGIVGAVGLIYIRRRCGIRAAAAALVVCLGTGGWLLIPSVFDPKEQSNAVKLGHIASYLAEFDRHPSYLVWGEGADTEFYTVGFGERTKNTEVTYLELVRNFGIPIAALLAIGLSWPLIMLLKGTHSTNAPSYLIIPYATYLLISGSNPILLNTTGLLLFLSVWARSIDVNRRSVPSSSLQLVE